MPRHGVHRSRDGRSRNCGGSLGLGGSEVNEQETALAKREANTVGGKVLALIPQTLDEISTLCGVLMKSNLAPKGATREGLMIRIMHGLEIGLKPMQAIQGIADINGHASIYGDAGIGLIQGSNLLEKHKEEFTGNEFDDDFTAHCIVKRVGCEVHTATFSVADAKRAKLWMKKGKTGQDTPWVTYPKRMLMWRARGFAFRDQFADVLKGLRFVEEVRDIPVATDVEWSQAEGDNGTDTATAEGTMAAMKEAVAEQPEAQEAAPAAEPETEAPPILGTGVPEAETPPEAGGSPID